MKKYLLVLLFLILPAISHAQGVYYRDVAFTLRNGVLVPAVNARITICDAPASGTPCTPTADIFSNEALTVAKANPIVTTALGAYDFYAAPGTYYYTVTGLGLNSQGPIRIDLGGGGGVNGMDGVGATSTITNASSVGTIVNKIAKLTGAPSRALVVATSDTGGAIGIVTAGAGVTGNATIQHMGVVSCVFDGATTAGNYVQISSAVSGNCDDVGSTYPTSGQIIGRVLSTNGSGGTYNIDLFPPELRGAGTGGGVTPEDCAPDFVSAISVGGIITCTPVGSGADILPLDNIFTQPNRFKGYVPWADVTAWTGGRQVGNALFPNSPTATCTSGSPNITLGSVYGGADAWQNNDGITIHGCGAATGLSTPAAPIVTPSVAAGGTMTDLVVNSAIGSSSYSYRAIARTKYGGLTAAGAVTTITTGLSSLGLQTRTITSLTLSNDSITVVTSAANQIAVGAMVHLFGSTVSTLNGWFSVTAVNSPTEFVLDETPIDSRGLGGSYADANTSTGGTVTYYLSNHITVPVVPNAWKYYICANRPGDGVGIYKLIGQTLPSNSGYIDNQFDDFGSTYMDGQTYPYYVTDAICTGAARPDPLTTTIVSGAGTANLVVANNASSSSSILPAMFDNAPALLAAVNYMFGGGISGGPIYIPPGIQSGQNYGLLLSSYVSLPAGTMIWQAGPVYLLETLELGAGTKWIGEWNSSSPAQFSFAGYPTVAAGYGADPAIYTRGSGVYLSHLSISGNPANGGTLLVTDDVIYHNLNYVNFITATQNASVADRLSMAVVNRSTSSGGNVYHYNNVLFNSGPDQVIDKSWTPLVYFAPGQDGAGAGFYANYLAKFTNTSWNRRGFEAHHFGGASRFEFDGLYRQGGITPLITLQNQTGNASSTLLLKNMLQDSEVQPTVTLLASGGTVGANITMTGVQNSSVDVGGKIPPITGLYPASAEIEGSFTGQVPTRNTIHNEVASAVGYPHDTTGTYAPSTNAIEIFNEPVKFSAQTGLTWDLQPPAAVNATLAAGGSLTVGTAYYWSVSAVDGMYQETVPSTIPDTVTPTSGNQTASITWDPRPGAFSYNVYRCSADCLVSAGRIGNGSNYRIVSTHVATNSLIDNGLGVDFGPSSVTTAGVVGINPTGVYSPTLNIVSPPNGSGVSTISSLKSIATSNGDVIFPDLAGTPSLFSPASIAAWAQPRCVRTGTTPGELLVAAEDCGSGGGGSGTVTSVGLVGTANQVTVTGSSPITNSGSFTISIPTNPTLPGTTTGTFLGNLAGNSTTTTGLAANGTNCNPGNYSRGVDAAGNAEDCTAAAGSGDALVANPLSQFASTTSAQLAGVLSNETGTGLAVFATSPSLTTPVLNVATATSINKVAITAPATNATLTIANGKTLTASNTLTLTGTDASSVSFGVGGTVGYKIAEGNAALGTSAIASGSCATVVTGTATGASASSDNLMADFNANPTGVTGYTPSASGMLSIIKFITTNTANFVVCNNTASSITPGAITLRWKVIR